MKYLHLMWAGLWRKPARTIFTLLSVLAAFALIGILQGVGVAFNHAATDANLDRLYISHRISLVEQLPLSYLSQIEKVPGVGTVAHSTYFGGYYRDPRQEVYSFAVDPRRFLGVMTDLHLPPEQLEALERTRTGAVVGRDLAQRHGWKIGDRVPLNSTFWNTREGLFTWEFDIVGIITVDAPMSAELFLFNYDYLDQARTYWNGTVGQYFVRVGTPGASTEVAQRIDKLFENSANETITQNEKEIAQMRLKQTGDIGFVVKVIVGAVLFALLFLTANTMMQSVRDRTAEFGVLKALGYTSRKIMALIFTEAFTLCVMAAVLGAVAATVLFPRFMGMMGFTQLPTQALWASLAGALVLALASAAVPAWRMKRLTVSEALRRA